MLGLGEMSREELLALLAAQTPTIETLTARLDALEAESAALRAENVELKRRLAQNSRNSSQPPSSDGAEQVPPPRSLRGKTSRKPGKQPGAQGFGLELVDDPEEIADHVPDRCRGCGTGLETTSVVGVVRRQVRDDAPAVVTITEHRLHQRRCGCGTLTTATTPRGVADAPVSYGPNLRACWVGHGRGVRDARARPPGYDCAHALCGAHIARELVTASETHPDQHWPRSFTLIHIA